MRQPIDPFTVFCLCYVACALLTAAHVRRAGSDTLHALLAGAYWPIYLLWGM